MSGELNTGVMSLFSPLCLRLRRCLLIAVSVEQNAYVKLHAEEKVTPHSVFLSATQLPQPCLGCVLT